MRLPRLFLWITSVLSAFAKAFDCTASITPESWSIDGQPVTVKVTRKGSFPVIDTDPWSYNTKIVDAFDNKLYFIDQKHGLIYMHSTLGDYSNKATKVFDLTETPIPGLSFKFSPAWTAELELIQMISPGSSKDEVYVVFSSKTLPAGLTATLLPDPYIDFIPSLKGNFDIFRLPGYDIVYKVFYKMTITNNKFVNPQPFYALQNQHGLGHFGGGMVTVPDGRILYAVGDCLSYGLNGREPSQDLSSHCGKILLIDPDDGSFEVAAMGVRNSQQMSIVDDKLMFFDMGGVSAEEVNAVCLNTVLDTSVIENFGWGMRYSEDFGREGTFKVEPGIALEDYEPDCIGPLSAGEREGFYDPVIQFSRKRTDKLPFYGISGFVASKQSFKNFQFLATEFNTGEAIVSKKNYCTTAQRGYSVRILDENNVVISGFNELNRPVLGLKKKDFARGDGRLFTYSDGSAGILMERTGYFYSIEEVTPTTIIEEDDSCACKSVKCKSVLIN